MIRYVIVAGGVAVALAFVAPRKTASPAAIMEREVHITRIARDSDVFKPPMEARDEQPLEELTLVNPSKRLRELMSRRADRGLKAYSNDLVEISQLVQQSHFTSKSIARVAQVIPEPDVNIHTDADYVAAAGSGIALAKIHVEGSNSAEWPDGDYRVCVYHVGQTWFGTVNATLARCDATTPHLNIARYRYYAYPEHKNPALKYSDFPATARWDFAMVSGTQRKPAVGLPCGDAWCVIHGKDPYLGDVGDPEDPARMVDNVPARLRIRGFYDRKPNPLGYPGDAYIFPAANVSAADPTPFDNWADIATIVYTSADGKKQRTFPVQVMNTANLNLWRIRFAGGSGKDLPRHPAGAGEYMPSAVRWGMNHYEGGGNSGLLKPFRFGETVLDEDDWGSMWVRCANGCCSAQVLY